jgi:hypothetical protein
MNVEIKNCLGAVILVCLGFIVGRLVAFPDVIVKPPESEIGRYQLIVSEIDLPHWIFMDDSLVGAEAPSSGKTLFRIDTKTGDVDYYFVEEFHSWGDTLRSWEYRWNNLTRAKLQRSKR